MHLSYSIYSGQQNDHAFPFLHNIYICSQNGTLQGSVSKNTDNPIYIDKQSQNSPLRKHNGYTSHAFHIISMHTDDDKMYTPLLSSEACESLSCLQCTCDTLNSDHNDL